MAKQKEGAAVQTSDVLSQAIKAAMARVETVKAKGGKTLIDEISEDDWANWDGGDEMALVKDPCGLEHPDLLDEDEEPQKAA